MFRCECVRACMCMHTCVRVRVFMRVCISVLKYGIE